MPGNAEPPRAPEKDYNAPVVPPAPDMPPMGGDSSWGRPGAPLADDSYGDPTVITPKTSSAPGGPRVSAGVPGAGPEGTVLLSNASAPFASEPIAPPGNEPTAVLPVSRPPTLGPPPSATPDAPAPWALPANPAPTPAPQPVPPMPQPSMGPPPGPMPQQQQPPQQTPSGYPIRQPMSAGSSASGGWNFGAGAVISTAIVLLVMFIISIAAYSDTPDIPDLPNAPTNYALVELILVGLGFAVAALGVVLLTGRTKMPAIAALLGGLVGSAGLLYRYFDNWTDFTNGANSSIATALALGLLPLLVALPALAAKRTSSA
jgi:hypothetical protein